MTEVTKPVWTEVSYRTYTFQVPGGTIYRHNSDTGGCAMVFVPHPAAQQVYPTQEFFNVPQAQVHRPYTPYHPGPHITRTSDTAGREVGMW